MNISIGLIPPAALSAADYKRCVNVLRAGKAVDPKNAREELAQAPLCAIGRDGDTIVGVGAIKRSRPDYAAGVAIKSGYAFSSQLHELGYVAVVKSHGNRGIARELVAELLKGFSERPLFATTSNDWMKRTLMKAGFKQRGKAWRGIKGMLSLWILEESGKGGTE